MYLLLFDLDGERGQNVTYFCLWSMVCVLTTNLQNLLEKCYQNVLLVRHNNFMNAPKCLYKTWNVIGFREFCPALASPLCFLTITLMPLQSANNRTTKKIPQTDFRRAEMLTRDFKGMWSISTHNIPLLRNAFAWLLLSETSGTNSLLVEPPLRTGILCQAVATSSVFGHDRRGSAQ